MNNFIFYNSAGTGLLLTSIFSALTACGGGGAATDKRAPEAKAQLQATQTSGAAVAATWTPCAPEGATCTFTGTQQVRYGNNGTYVTKTAMGSIACTNAVFGDPLPGLTKSCSYAPAPTPNLMWTPCATEGGQCNFSGTQQVRYGDNGIYFTKTATGSIACTNATFGDPLPGLAKACSYSGTTTPPPPPPPGGIPAVAQAAGFTHLIFSDEFDTANISPNGAGTYPWYNGIWYESPSPASSFKSSNSVLTASVMPSDQHEAWLTTLNRSGGQSTLFNLGYFEARMKWNKVMDNFSAWWLESSEHALANANDFCEIDIFEAYPNYGSVFAGSVVDWYLPNKTINSNNVDQTPGVDYSQWHTYGLLWTTSTITWYLDGKIMHSWPTPNVCKTQKLFMILGAQVHGHTDQVNLDVDWVRVYR